MTVPIDLVTASRLHDRQKDERQHLVEPSFEIAALGEHVRHELDPSEGSNKVAREFRRIDGIENITLLDRRTEHAIDAVDPVDIRLRRSDVRAHLESQTDARSDNGILDDLTTHFIAEHDQLFESRCVRLSDQTDRVHRDRVLLLDDYSSKIILRLEVEVQRALGDTGQIDDLGQASALESGLVEPLGSSPDDLLPSRDRSLLLDHYVNALSCRLVFRHFTIAISVADPVP
jgi:hypothetical protein